MSSKNEKKEEKRFSPTLEIADFELEQIVGGCLKGGYTPPDSKHTEPQPANTLPLQASPFTLPAWMIHYLNTHPLHMADSGSEARRH